MKNIKEILNEFVKECSEKLELESIIQFGSSAYSDNFNDIDLLLLSKKDILPTKEILVLIKIITNFEKRYPEVVFDFGSTGTRKRKAKYSITVIFLSKKEIAIKYNPHDLFFIKSIIENKNVNLLYGKNLLKGMKINLTNQHLFEMLSVDRKHALRRSLDDFDFKKAAFYHLFKTYLYAMLINDGSFSKEELLEKFNKKFDGEIKLPKNSENIINKKIKEKDFEDILKFTEDCLKWLIGGRG